MVLPGILEKKWEEEDEEKTPRYDSYDITAIFFASIFLVAIRQKFSHILCIEMGLWLSLRRSQISFFVRRFRGQQLCKNHVRKETFILLSWPLRNFGKRLTR